MNTALAALAFLMIPVAVAAQDAPPPGPPPDGPMAVGSPNPQRMAEMRQVRAQLEQLRTQTRAQMLASLTPLHRSQIATLVGQAAVSSTYDPRTLAQRVDALLSRGEAQSVVNLAGSERTNARGVMQAARAQFESSLSPADQAKMKERDAAFAAREAQRGGRREGFAPDPGRELIRTMLGGGEGHGGGPGWHGGGPMGEPHP